MPVECALRPHIESYPQVCMADSVSGGLQPCATCKNTHPAILQQRLEDGREEMAANPAEDRVTMDYATYYRFRQHLVKIWGTTEPIPGRDPPKYYCVSRQPQYINLVAGQNAPPVPRFLVELIKARREWIDEEVRKANLNPRDPKLDKFALPCKEVDSADKLCETCKNIVKTHGSDALKDMIDYDNSDGDKMKAACVRTVNDITWRS